MATGKFVDRQGMDGQVDEWNRIQQGCNCKSRPGCMVPLFSAIINSIFPMMGFSILVECSHVMTL